MAAKGDYDFNDFVTGYSYSLIKGNNDKDVKAIRLTFIPRALGASYNSGFGIQLPIETNNIENVTGGNIEKDETKATIIIMKIPARMHSEDTAVLSIHKKEMQK